MTELRTTEVDTSHFRLRAIVIGAVVFLAFALVVARLVFLQVLRYEDFAERAESNRTAIIPVVPNRGLILDRNGVVLATNYAAYTLEITPSKVANLSDTIDALAEVVDIHQRDRRRFKRLKEESRNFDSLPIRTRLTDEEVARFSAQRYRFAGVDVKARLFRSYPLGEVASHAIGYIGRINQTEKAQIQDSEDEANYRGTEYIGKLGIEQSYETQLHGKTGVEQLETSAGGRAIRRLSGFAATPGSTVMLSIDIGLQKLVEDLFGERRGALVAINPKNGEILAFVSKPTFDPNLFVDGIDHESWNELNTSIDRPLLNRALRGTYPPGSTYKPFMALGALETGKRSANTVIHDGGTWTFGGHVFRSHGSALGAVDMHRSIVKSSNVYYYSLANEMGVDLIHDFMAPLGFGQMTGIDVNGEVRGVLPNQDWKRKAYRRTEQKKWYAGETISLGIGQGYNNFTILQLAHALATVVDNGISRVPHVGKVLIDPDGKKTPIVQQPPIDLGYKPGNVAAVKRGMVSVVTGGTGRGSFGNARYSAGGKTGTAQAITIGQKEKYNAARLAERQRDHALYVAFAPAEDPKIAVAVIVENAGFGAGSAAPIARRIIDYWLLGDYPSEADMAAMQRGQATAPIGTPRRAEDIRVTPQADTTP